MKFINEEHSRKAVLLSLCQPAYHSLKAFTIYFTVWMFDSKMNREVSR